MDMTPSPRRAGAGTDEPEVRQEEDVPVDERDPVAEDMMREVGNDKLVEPGGREHKTPEKSSPSGAG